MGRSKSDKAVRNAQYLIPKAPFLYINDPTNDAAFVSKLSQMIPKTLQVSLSPCPDHSAGYLATMKDNQRRDTVYIFTDHRSDNDGPSKKIAADHVRQAAIKVGSNFASINLLFDGSTKSTKLGSNHVDFVVAGRPEYVTATEVEKQAEKMYTWLFTVFAVKDTLHLISDDELLRVGQHALKQEQFHNHTYTTIKQSPSFPKDAKIMYVGLVLNKPMVFSEKKLCWQIADKSGVANFFFKWRGQSSQQTWDWVLSFKPGQRICLPRMPHVLVKENLLTAIVKAPVRVPGAVLRETGYVITLMGSCVHKAGKLMRMGQRKKWVFEADVEDYLQRHDNMKAVPAKGQSTVKVFTEKDGKTWDDKDSSHSTLRDQPVQKQSQTWPSYMDKI